MGRGPGDNDRGADIAGAGIVRALTPADARRALKPEIPLTGSFGISMRDELQLELRPAEWDDIITRYRWPSS